MSLKDIKKEHESGKRICRPKINWLIKELEAALEKKGTPKDRLALVRPIQEEDEER